MPHVRQASLFAIVAVAILTGRTTDAVEITPKSPVPRDTLVRIKYDAGQGITILRQDFSAVDFIDCGGGAAAFCGPPGRYAVFASSEGKLNVTVVEISDGGPSPVPPGPVPPEPLPAIARAVYDLAVQVPVQDRPLSQTLSSAFRTAASSLSAGLSRVQVRDQLKADNERILATQSQRQSWKAVGNYINSLLNDLEKNNPAGTVNALREISQGLEAVR